MNFSSFRNGRRLGFRLLLIVSLAVAGTSCRRARTADGDRREPVDLPVELTRNQAPSYPGPVLQAAAGSAIHWQPWTPEVLEMAQKSHRPVFALITLPHQPVFHQVMDELAASPAIVGMINGHYVPVLIDGDAAREMGLLTADLSAELRQGLSLPMFVWFSPQGNPVAWRGAADTAMSVAEVFSQAHWVVSRMWSDNSKYVMENSAVDQQMRSERMLGRLGTLKVSEQPAADTLSGIRELTALYDPVSRSFDSAGGLFPAGSLDLLAAAAVQPALPRDLRQRCVETVRGLMDDLLAGAMFDPLDGGVFASRRGVSWSLPAFTRDCATQGRAAVALFRVYRATGDSLVLERARGLIEFAEKTYSTPQGLFSIGAERPTATDEWLWQVEEIQKVLPEEDAGWWIKANRMRGLGNLPSEADPERAFFRGNTLGLSQSLEEIAAENAIDPGEFAARFEAARKLLLKVREERLGTRFRDDIPHAGCTFRMVSAYAAAFVATGEHSYRERAVELLERARAAFTDGPRLRLYTQEAPPAVAGGRAFLYALAVQAAFDVADITTEERWADWANHLTTTAAELFVRDGYLAEVSEAARVTDQPVSDLSMLFDDSSAGLFASATARLEARRRPVVPAFGELVTPLPLHAAVRPILHTDRLLAALARHHGGVVLLAADLPPGLRLAVQRLPLRTVQRVPAVAADEVPPGAVKLILPGADPQILTDADLLQEALLPSGGKR